VARLWAETQCRRHQVIRENYSDQAEGVARQSALQIEALGVNNILPLLPTRLSPVQLAEAEAAFARLGNHPLDFAIDHFLRTWKPSPLLLHENGQRPTHRRRTRDGLMFGPLICEPAVVY